jgi:hypothetical protein
MHKTMLKSLIVLSAIIVMLSVSCTDAYDPVIQQLYFPNILTLVGSTQTAPSETETWVSVAGLSSPSFINYKLDKTAWNFGYASSATEKTITVTNTTSSTISFAGASLPAGSKFSIVTMPQEVSSGDSANIKVSYTPSGSTSWDESVLLLNEASSIKITLIGSDYKQPDSFSGGNLAFWMRSDLIGKSDLVANGADGIT